MKNKRLTRGSIIFMVLIIAIVTLILMTTVVGITRQNLTYVTFHRDKAIARQMADAGVNYALNQLSADRAWQNEYTWTSGERAYQITFNTGNQYYSVNNLNSTAPHATSNFQGKEVKPYTADLVITGTARRSSSSPITSRIHVIVRNQMNLKKSLACSEKITLQENFLIKGIITMLEPDVDVGGGIHSNYIDENDPSIVWNGSGSIIKGNTASISTVGTVSANMNYLGPVENSAEIVLPEYSVEEFVQRKTGCPQPSGLTLNPGLNKYFSGYLNLNDERYVNKGLTVNGDLCLANGTLYVNGDLTINGGIKGHGSVFVTGKLYVLGGNTSLITNQVNSIAVFTDGGADLQGLSAAGYLENLANQYPEINEKYQPYKKRQATLEAFLRSKEQTGTWDFNTFVNGLNGEGSFERPHGWLSMFIGSSYPTPGGRIQLPPPPGFDPDAAAAVCLWWAKYRYTAEGTQDWINKIADPDGVQVSSKTEANVTGLIKSIEDTTPLASDPQAQKVLRGLTDLNYFYRHNCPYPDPFNDSSLPAVSQSFDHLIWYFLYRDGQINGIPYAPGEPKTITPQEYVKIFSDLTLNNNPLNANWAGDSYLQGVFYSNGNITISNQLEIYGGIICHGNVTLNNAKLIYCQEYMKLFGGITPLTVVLHREL